MPDDYQQYYLIGGSTSWANIRDALEVNSDIRLLEQKGFESKKVDIWGVSNADLFRESAQMLSNSSTPFFAIIQTAGNHRPYTIPDKKTKFVCK